MLMRILRPLLGLLSAGKPHCDGITPIDQPRNTYFEAMWHEDNLDAAMVWLVRADRDADHIDHYLLQDQLHQLLPAEPELNRLIWLSLRRTVAFGGNYRDVVRGIPLGSSLSPLLN